MLESFRIIVSGVAVIALASMSSPLIADTSVVTVPWVDSAILDSSNLSQASDVQWSRDELIWVLELSTSSSQGTLLLERESSGVRQRVMVHGIDKTRHQVLDASGKEFASWSSRPATIMEGRCDSKTVCVMVRVSWVELTALGGRPNPGDRWKASWESEGLEPQTQWLQFAPPIGSEPHLAAWVPQGVKTKVSGAPDAPPDYRLVPTASHLDPTWPIQAVTEPGTRNLWVIEEDGSYGPTQIVRLPFDANQLASSPEKQSLIQLPMGESEVAYSIAFHPRYRENGLVFVGSNGGRDGEPKQSRVTRYRVRREAPYDVEPDSRQIIIQWPSDGHNGAAIAFGSDGMLYVTSGDGTADSDRNGMGQGTDHLLSKVLRINVDDPTSTAAYSVPVDNPFVDDARFRPETWAYGFRNPWRIAADPRNGRIWVGNNGQDLWEQVYRVERGANYGWPVFEGSHPFHASRPLGPTPVSQPAFEHHHAEARSLTGGVVYLGDRFPELHGAYIYGDYATGRIWGAMLDEQGNVLWHRLIADGPQKLTALEVDPDGELLICDHQPSGQAAFYTLERVSSPPFDPAAFPRRLSQTGLFASISEHRPIDGAIPYTVNAPLWSDGAAKSRFVVLPPRIEGQDAPAPITVSGRQAWSFPEGTVIVKSFGIESEQGAIERWIETRVMLLEQGEWSGYTYRWNDAGDDAQLVEAAGEDAVWPVAQSQQEMAWHYPSRTECLVCHSRAAGFVLGLSMSQIEGPFVRDSGFESMLGDDQLDPESLGTKDRLRHFARLGVLRTQVDTDLKASLAEWQRFVGTASDSEATFQQLLSLTPPATSAWNPDLASRVDAFLLPRSKDVPEPPLVNPAEEVSATGQVVPLEWRARSYLHANCAHCHVEAGGGNAKIDLSAFVDRGAMRLVDQVPLHGSPEIAGSLTLSEPRLVVPGNPERSVLWLRVTHRGSGQMPPLSTFKTDPLARELLREWIEQWESTGEVSSEPSSK